MTKQELIAQCKAENPQMFQEINGEIFELTGKDYEDACINWAEMRLQQIAVEQAELEAQAKKMAALEKLAALGLNEDDLKALGL